MLCDFDGTIIEIDTAEYVLHNFSQDDWKIYDRELELGKISIEECMQKQFETVRVSKEKIITLLERRQPNFRPHFDSFLHYCHEHKVPVIIVSAGLDFLINHFLRKNGLHKRVKVYAAKTEVVSQVGIKFEFPPIEDPTAVDFKDDIVKKYKSEFSVLFIGDGSGDFHALKSADYGFAVKGSILAELCEKNTVPYQIFEDFQEIIEEIRKIRS
ncbi:MAG: HAD-IB family phosphatase [Candidatus Heimdallarchaeota archaeon]|nr:MAG: HAD-IB family phosphatase [Candidatus Heimdallarchaeota archaeon]